MPGGLLLMLLVAAGCSNADPASSEETVPTTSSQPTTTASSTTTSDAPPQTIPFEDVPPLAIFLAAIDRGLSGTEFEGDVYLDPQSFVNTGRLFCSLLDVGVTPTEVLESYVTAIQAEGAEFNDDELLLGGVVLGASVQVICPDYSGFVRTSPGGR